MEITEKQQELITIFVATGIKIAAGMKIGKTPDEIAGVMSAILARLEDAGERNGLNFDLATKFHGSQQILTFILGRSGVKVTEEMVKEVIGKAMGKYFHQAVQSGRMSKEELANLGREAAQYQKEQK